MDKKTKKEKLMKQILKFGVVGGLAFLIDFIVYTIVLSLLDWKYGYLIAGFVGFTVSLSFNYIASMAFVFERKENADKKKEFVVFMMLSLVGMGINTLVLWLCVEVIYEQIHWVQTLTAMIFDLLAGIGIHIASVTDLAALIAKCVATGVVMVYNFISRKIVLEKKEDEPIEQAENELSTEES